MITAITGPNVYAARRRLDEITTGFIAEHGELALTRIDGEEAEPKAIFEAAASLPFLSSRQMVVVRSLSANKPAADKLEQIISSVAESTDLIIYEPITDKRTVYFKSLKAKTQLEEYKELDANELAKWLANEAKKAGGSLSAADATYLVERVGLNQAMLSSELEKLMIYEPNITRANIELLTEPTPQSKVFELLDAAFSGDKQKALKLYEEQRAQKVEPQAILAMIGWQLRLIALAKHSGGKRAEQVAKDAGANIYPVNKAFGLAGRIEASELDSMVSEALDIDYRGKTTSLDMDEALKTYIVASL